MKSVVALVITLIVCQVALGQQLPYRDIKTQVSTGFFEQGWHRADSGHILAVRAPNFTPRYAGTMFLYQAAGDTSIVYWTGDRFVVLTPGIDSTSLSNRINLKVNASDTSAMLSPYLRKLDTTNKWVQDIYGRNDSVFKKKNASEIFIALSGGEGTPANVRYSVTKGAQDSIQLVNDITVTPEMGKEWRYGFDSTGSVRGYQEDKYVIGKKFQEFRQLRSVDTAHVYRLISSGLVSDFYFDPNDNTTPDDTIMTLVTTSGKRLKRYVSNWVDVRWFGANPAADGVNDYPYIQRAIDWCIANRTHGTLYIPAGSYLLYRGLLVRKDANGDGVSEFVSLDIVGDKISGNDNSENGGETVLHCYDSTDFGIGIQKGKTMMIKNIGFEGLNRAGFNVNEHNVGLTTGSSFLTEGCRNNRQSPYAGIVIDPFGQSSVPSVNRYPQRTALYTEVGNSGSSAIVVSGCFIRGFTVGIANSVNGTQQNAEGHSFLNLWLSNCKSAIVNCNSQARTVYCHDIKAWGGIECVFDHQRYGDGTSSAMLIDNVNLAGAVKYIIAATNWGIGYYHQLNKVHAESTWAIGGDIVNGTQLGHISFKNSQIDLTGENGGIQRRAPVAAWCSTLELQDSYIGYYSANDGDMMFVHASMVIMRNCSGSLVCTQSSYDNTVFNELSSNSGNKPVYFVTDGNGIANQIVLRPGLEIFYNGYLEFSSGGLLLKRKYCGKGMNVFGLSGTYAPVSVDTNARTAVFNAGAEIYKIPPGSQIVTLLPDDFGNVKYTTLGVVTAVDVGAQTFNVNKLSSKIAPSTTGLFILIYQQPLLITAPGFYIGDLTSGSPTITNVSGDFGSAVNIQAGQYFNHPAFLPGTYVVSTTSNSITLSRNAIYSEVGAFVLNETSWENTGIGGEYQTTNNGFNNSLVFKEGDIVRMGYSNNSSSLDTNKLAFVCVKSGRFNSAHLPIFKPLYANSPTVSSGTAAPGTTPSKVGDIFIDITNKKLYFATGTSSSSDWTIAN